MINPANPGRPAPVKQSYNQLAVHLRLAIRGLRRSPLFATVAILSLIWIVMREVLLLLAIGLAIGMPSAMALGRYVAAQLDGIQAHDPFIAGSTVLLLTIVSAAAGLLPAQRASRTDPIMALRQE